MFIPGTSGCTADALPDRRRAVYDRAMQRLRASSVAELLDIYMPPDQLQRVMEISEGESGSPAKIEDYSENYDVLAVLALLTGYSKHRLEAICTGYVAETEEESRTIKETLSLLPIEVFTKLRNTSRF